MARIEITPSEILFSQDSIKNRFGDGTHHSNTLIGETLDDILSGECRVSDIPTISVVKKRGVWVTADNRRLWVFKKLHKLGKCDKITATVTNYLNPKKNCIQSTTRVRQNGNVGGHLWRILEKQINSGTCPLQRKVSGYSTQNSVLLDSLTKSDSPEVKSLYDSDTSSLKSFCSVETVLGNYSDSKRENIASGYSDDAFSISMVSALPSQCMKSNRSNDIRREASSCSSSGTRLYRGTPKYSLPTEKTVSDTNSVMSNTKYAIPAYHSQTNSSSISTAASIDHRPILHSNYAENVTKSLSSENLCEIERSSSHVLEQEYPPKESQSNNSSDAAVRNISSCSGFRNATNYNKPTKDSLLTDKKARCTLHNINTSENVAISRRTVSERNPRSLEDNTLAATEVSEGDTHGSRKYPSKSTSVQEEVQSPLASSGGTVIDLNPLDIGFAGTFLLSFDGNYLGELLDKCSEHFLALSMTILVFKYQGKFYSEEVLKLFKAQMLHRLTGKVQISGTLIPRPMNVSIYRLHDYIISVDRISGQKWKSLITLNSLPTRKSLNISLANIFYTRSSIQGIFNERSIAKELVEVFSSRRRNHELNVMEYENKYYSLENEKLWILKHAEKVVGKFTISGNVKISMDFIMFHSFTAKCIEKVDVQLSPAMHTDEEKFILEYIHRMENPFFSV